MKRIGILGGTFNPVHIGHLAIAEVALQQLKLDKVIFVPSYLPPHKSSKAVIDSVTRSHMVSLAIQGRPQFENCDFEINRRQKSYSIETVRYLRHQYPAKTRFYFIIGSDMVPTLGRWKMINEILKYVTFAVIGRKSFKNTKSKYRIKYLTTLDLGIASSFLRKRIRERKTVRYLIPESVYSYIRGKKLYIK